MGIAAGFLTRSEVSPGRDALVTSGGRTSYGELARKVYLTAREVHSALGRAAVPRRVGIACRDPALLLQLLLGTVVAGHTAAVMNPGSTTDERKELIRILKPALLLPCKHAAGVPGAFNRAVPEIDESAPFYIGFTSGSSSRPKAFQRNHRSWLASFQLAETVLDLQPAEDVLVPGPLHHSLFLFAAVHGLHLGCTVHLLRRFHPSGALKVLQDQPVTRIYAVPTMIAALTQAAGGPATSRGTSPAAGPFPHVRTLACTGSRWSPGLKAQATDLFPKAHMADFYGASELSFVSMASGLDAPAESAGRPLPGVEVKVQRADGSQAPAGEPGRIFVRSEMTFSGYLPGDGAGDREESWSASLQQSRPGKDWVTAADTGYLDEQGYLFVTGREQDMMICGGQNVYPQPAENALLELEEVCEVGVVGLPDPLLGELPTAVIRWRPGAAPLSRARLAVHCRVRLPGPQRPRRFIAVPYMPHTPGGKIARNRLRDQVQKAFPAAEEIS